MKCGGNVSPIRTSNQTIVGNGQENNQVAVQKESNPSNKSGFWNRDLDDMKKDYAGAGGFALGYQYRNFKLNGETSKTTHGIHMDVPLVYSKIMLPFIYPSLTVEADIGFPNAAVSGGIGAGLHFILPSIVQAYAKVMLDGHLASLGEGENHAAWSAEVVAGGQLLIFYGEGRFPLAGSKNLKANGGFTTGFRFGF